jgi:hypothetical protein
LLAKHGQQHNAPTRREKVRDAPRHSDHIEPKLEEPIAQRSRGKHPQRTSPIRQPFDMRKHAREVVRRQLAHPLLDLRLQLDDPHDIKDDITA